MSQELPNYKLIQALSTETECEVHKREYLLDLYNQANEKVPRGPWTMQVVDVDKIQFKCSICGNERVYQILPEKTLL